MEAMSDMMSDMKTTAKRANKKPARARRKPEPRREFTVRDLNRHTAELLEAARKHGSVTVRSREGEAFQVRPIVPARQAAPADAVTAVANFKERMRKFRARLAAVGYKEPTAEGWEAIAKAIAGE